MAIQAGKKQHQHHNRKAATPQKPQPNMPGLTLDTAPGSAPSSSPTQPSTAVSHQPTPRASSPVQSPPYSPITPTLPAARPVVSGASPFSSRSPHQQQQTQPQPSAAAAVSRQTYTHTQPPQTFVPQPAPPPDPTSLDANPDALALKSALSILQLQRKRAIQDIQTLSEIKERAAADPTGFAEALKAGRIETRREDGVFAPVRDGDRGEEGREVEGAEEGQVEEEEEEEGEKEWPSLPRPQNIVRTPAINWSQYGIVGESLDRLHTDQVANPPAGAPATIKQAADGSVSVVYPPEGKKGREDTQGNVVDGVRYVAAAYAPGRDRVEKGIGSGHKDKKRKV
jgi:hypothetical protein